MNEATCAQAAWNGNLEVLKWCRANQCPWIETTCSHAAINGHLEDALGMKTHAATLPTLVTLSC
jgi:hypothetical protein